MIRTSSITLLVLGLLASCSSISVSTDYDPEADFSRYQTYAWIESTSPSVDPRVQNDLIDSRVRKAVETELAERGFAHGDDPNLVDLLVTFHAAVDDKLEVRTMYDDYPYSYYRGWSHATTTVDEYQVGALVIDFVDARDKKLVWQGSAQARVNLESSPERKTERIREAVSKILDEFPPD